MTTAPGHLSTLTDGALMQRVARADVAAFETFYERHISCAYATSYRAVGGRQPADEVCQEAFLSIWRSAARFDPARGSGRSWVQAIVRNRAIDHLRRTRRAKERELLDDDALARHPAPERDGTEPTAMRHARSEEVGRLLAILTADQRRVIELSFYGGYTHTQIALLLDVPLGTVKARASRGLHQMRTWAPPGICR